MKDTAMTDIPQTRDDALALARAASKDLLAAKATFATFVEKMEALAEYAQTMDIPNGLKGRAISAWRISLNEQDDLQRLHDRILDDLNSIDQEAGDIVVQSR